MIEPGQDFRFALKAREALDVGCHHFGKNLDGDGSLQVGIRCPIHLAHPSFANLDGNLVRTEASARNQGHRKRLRL
jgi:hypothetical protein